MKLYFVIEENISKNPDVRGTKYICKKGIRYNYGEFKEKYGFVNEHKADLELDAALRYYNSSQFKTSSDIWIHYKEVHEI